MKKENGRIISRMLYFIILAVLLFVIVKLYDHYKQNNFNEFVTAEYNLYSSKFVRDSEIKYSKYDSYKIVSNTQNDAMFYKTINVTPNTPYKVTCMVKTENVKTKNDISNGGAHISISGSVEKSKSITGTNDWQKLEMIFNSKNRSTVDVGFRLGGYDDECTGTVWFSDFNIEVGSQTADTNWNFVCFVFENTDVQVANNTTKYSMTTTDISDLRQNMDRFKKTCQELSKNKMTVSYDFVQIKTPITSLSYDKENGYYVGYENIANIIDPYLEKENYDHIFVCVRLGDNEHQKDIPVYDWIGLGGMEYVGIGFSNIRLPNANNSYTYKYNARINTFPEEVFLHEFLHTLEKNAKDYGFDRPELHSYSEYGYEDDLLEGLKEWYEDYMNGTIRTSSGYIGLPSEIYKLQPNNEEDFKFSYNLQEFKEPQNIFEEIKAIVNRAVKNVNYITKQKEENTV